MNNRSNTLLLTRRNGRVRSFAYNPRHALVVITITVLAVCAAILYGGFRLGVNLEARSQLNEVRDLQAHSQRQQAQIEAARTAAQNNLDALTLRLGRMQAQILRLDALGKRLVEVADLDAGEFDFNVNPPVGGPAESAVVAENSVPDFLGMLDSLDSTAADREHKLIMLEQVLMHRNVSQRVTPSGRAVESGLLSSTFGMRIDPFSGKRESHKGIDIAGKEGSIIQAVGDGLVTFAGTRKGYGNLVEVDHGNGYTTRYAHNRDHLVNVGETVRKGDPVALMGSTGRSTGPHVHLEVLRDGKQVDPANYINN
ncbi:MAG: M23 family metallopeptidase [Thiohalobacterales bacterium]|nr:M23 family metallopeptidase [Thiohalobacterales bacterium]